MRHIANLFAALIVFACLVVGIGPAHLAPAARAAGPAYPLAVSANKHYLVDQAGAPYLLVGDSPQSLVVNVSVADAGMYFADRAAHGFNAVLVDVLVDTYTFGRSDGSTYDGILPFTAKLPSGSYNLATPNSAYFARVDTMMNLAAQNNLAVFLDPIETGGWLQVLRDNGTAAATNFGVWLGNRYKDYPNIMWQSGNDFQSWRTASDDALVQAVANGIRSVAPQQIQTAELDYPVSDTLNDPSWAPIIGIDAAYTYYPTYAEVLTAYNRNQLPAVMIEANYEDGGQFGNVGTLNVLRRQEYWTLLSGAAGQLYADEMYTVRFVSGWQTHLDTVGVQQLGYSTALFAARRWYNLVPDQNHTLVTAGYGTFSSSGLLKDNDYLTAARTPDGTLAMAYMPTARVVTVDMSKMVGQVTARWYDPTSGQYSAIGSFANAGTRQFTPPGSNGGGDGDWVLVLEASAGSTPTATSTVTATPGVSHTATSTWTRSTTRTVTPTSTATPTATALPSSHAPSFVQEQDNRATSGTTLSAVLPNGVSAGHTLLAYVICDASENISVTDNRGDAFAPVAPAMAWGSSRKAQAFVAKNVAGGNTTASTTFSTPLNHSGLLYLIDYAGANATNPVDATAEAAGTGNPMSSGSAITSQATDLLVGLGVSDNMVTAGGPGYTTRSTFRGNTTEDIVTTRTGSYSATATHNGTSWAMQVVALRP